MTYRRSLPLATGNLPIVLSELGDEGGVIGAARLISSSVFAPVGGDRDDLVAGVDSSTQSCKVVVRDADTGRLVRSGRAPHPDGTEVDPAAWWRALEAAVSEAGGLDDVAAVAVGGQQHGMVCLDEHGGVVRPALLWNDTRSAQAAADLVAELGGGERGGAAWAEAVGSVPVASFTVTKLRWLAEHEPRARPSHCRRVPAPRLADLAAGGLGRPRGAGH